MNECVIVCVHGALGWGGVFLPCAQCPYDRLQNDHDPDQNRELTKDEGMNEFQNISSSIVLLFRYGQEVKDLSFNQVIVGKGFLKIYEHPTPGLFPDKSSKHSQLPGKKKKKRIPSNIIQTLEELLLLAHSAKCH